MGKYSSAVGFYIDALLSSPELSTQITDHRILPEAAAIYGNNHFPWPTGIKSILDSRGISLYSHQTLATDHIRAGHATVIATPTASGKSLIYNLPVLERCLLDPEARSLYLFPLKALAQDQLSAFNALCQSWPRESRPSAALYDGDTCDAQRRKIRSSPPNVLITNPEMLHLGILPFHEKWTMFLANLSYVVVDEAHTYRGIFGSHMAQVFRRLNRLANRYGSQPTYIFCTATLGNPQELTYDLMGTGDTPFLINKSGAPQGKRHFMFIDPEKSPSTCAIDLLKKALENDLRTIVYCRSRRMTELISLWAGDSPHFASQISSYRAGYLPEERREIEAKMADGTLKAVVSTSALELGIDIGGLDVCILVGYPGTVMQTMQRGGRVGRNLQDSAVILVAGEDALDQYFARNPNDFFNRPPEKAVINPTNEIILARHLECAAAEAPLQISEHWLSQKEAQITLGKLQKDGILMSASSGNEWFAVNKNPQRKIDLRGCGQNYSIEDESGKTIGNLDGFRAWKEGHPGAVYLHRGRNYVINDIDCGKMLISARQSKVDWFTRTRGNKSTDILDTTDRIAVGNCAIFKGRLRVNEFITGYEKRSVSDQRLLTIHPLKAPPNIFETDGIWIVVPDSIRNRLEEKFIHFMGSIHALEHAAIGMLPLLVMADRNDFGGISIPMHLQLGLPAIFIYDAIPGGAGLVNAAFEDPHSLLTSTYGCIAKCTCEDGCPSCIHSPKCGSGNRPLSKKGAIMLLEELLTAGDLGRNICDTLTVSPPPDRFELTQDDKQKNISVKSITNPAAEAWFTRLETSSIANTSKAAAPPEHFIVFDVETRRSATEVGGWNNASQMGVSVVCTYDSKTDTYADYRQDELPMLFKELTKAHLIIGFNSIRFDYEVLRPFAEISPPIGNSGFKLRNLPSLDLMQRILEKTGTRISLDNLGHATLNAQKNANGLLALNWWKNGEINKIIKYCRKDVELTRDLYLFGLREGYVQYTNKAGAITRVSVDFQTRI